MPFFNTMSPHFFFSVQNFPIQITCQELQVLYTIAGEISTGLFLTCLFPHLTSSLRLTWFCLNPERKPYPHCVMPLQPMPGIIFSQCVSVITGWNGYYSINPASQYLMWEGIYLRGFNNWSMSSLKFHTLSRIMSLDIFTSIKRAQIYFILFQVNPRLSECIMSPNLHDCQGTSNPLAPSFLLCQIWEKEKTLTQWQTIIPRFLLIRFSGESCTWRRELGGRHNVLWDDYNGLSPMPRFEFGCLQFAFCKIRAQENRLHYLKVILLQAGCRNCSLSINQVISVNNTHGTVPLLLRTITA